MFDAVNSIERRYRPYLVQLPAERSTSEDAAAATAAPAVEARHGVPRHGRLNDRFHVSPISARILAFHRIAFPRHLRINYSSSRRQIL
jgi:hypothetical protein